MATVADYMDRHLVYLRAGSRVEIARRPLLDFGLTAVPILNDEHRPVGVVSLRDLVDARPGAIHVSENVRTILASATMEEAARALVRERVHHLVVVDSSGEAVGMLSSMDIVRGLIGAPTEHPGSVERFVAQAKDGDVECEYRSE